MSTGSDALYEQGLWPLHRLEHLASGLVLVPAAPVVLLCHRVEELWVLPPIIGSTEGPLPLTASVIYPKVTKVK